MHTAVASVHTGVAIRTCAVSERRDGTVVIVRVIQHCVSQEMLIITTAGGSGTLLTKSSGVARI